jgi:hypothetical protein
MIVYALYARLLQKLTVVSDRKPTLIQKYHRLPQNWQENQAGNFGYEKSFHSFAPDLEKYGTTGKNS